MITLEQAIKLATEAHKGQWRKPTTVTSDKWDCHKQQTEFIHKNSNKIVWCNGNTFLEYEPYITHPLAVMNMMDTDEEKIVAVLHDVFEMSEYVLTDADKGSWVHLPNTLEKVKLNSQWIPNRIVGALDYLTKDKVSSYENYIEYITQNKIATKVKIADIVHNLSCSPSDHAKQKYLKAIPVLLKSL